MDKREHGSFGDGLAIGAFASGTFFYALGANNGGAPWVGGMIAVIFLGYRLFLRYG